MQRGIAVLSLVVALVLAFAGTAVAKENGLSQSKLEQRGWTCFPGPTIVHCLSPNTDIGALVAGDLPSVPSLNFAVEGGSFIGTETMIRADLFNGQPCPQGGFQGEFNENGQYERVDVNLDGSIDYYSCLHNNEV